ncbi:SCA7-domain-containing protein [Ceraceosorus guamensis]|uniref:SCA7-domain-containing protein n=1 Tax=Ceraceosorus guamensis TaxID=1522189 RepID=A0A316W389_9BASI|nr:SCA7-domain-containing protein [Ceraceosorus guamensis]PWN43061.1 SCA7-domain-containing protein [Ceraceosorus guamensis]
MNMSHPTWDDISKVISASPSPSSPSRPVHPAWYDEDIDITDFGPSPLHDRIKLVKCSVCGRTVLKDAWVFHTKNCAIAAGLAEGRLSPSILALPIDSLNARRGSLDGGSDADVRLSRNGAGGKPLSKKAQKEAEAAQRRLERAKKKEDKLKNKSKRVGAGPLDVDRQCGVPTEKGLCARSLTCKTHSMRAKREVPGRSQPYDDLLLEWQKAHNPNFVAKLEEKERMLAANAEAKAKRAKEKLKAKRKGNLGRKLDAQTDKGTVRVLNAEEEEEEDEDMDDELDSVLHSLRDASRTASTRALPIMVPDFAGIYTARRRRLIRCRELFRTAIGTQPMPLPIPPPFAVNHDNTVATPRNRARMSVSHAAGGPLVGTSMQVPGANPGGSIPTSAGFSGPPPMGPGAMPMATPPTGGIPWMHHAFPIPPMPGSAGMAPGAGHPNSMHPNGPPSASTAPPNGWPSSPNRAFPIPSQ